LRITHLLGAGSTGGVYVGLLGEKCFAVKVVEVLCLEDLAKRQRLSSAFKIYAHLDQAYSAGRLVTRVVPRCHGAFWSKRLDALVMDLHGDSLFDWNDLVQVER
jgi:uncharacterized membrane protein